MPRKSSTPAKGLAPSPTQPTGSLLQSEGGRMFANKASSVTENLDARKERDDKIIAEAHAKGDARQEEAKEAENQENQRKSGLSWDETIKEAPEHVATMMRNMRADYTRKTQEIAQERKTLLAEREALMKSGTLDKLRETANKEIPELDPFNEASVSARIEREVAKRLAEALAPLEQEHKQSQAKQQYHSFLDQHPDLKADQEVRDEVFKALKANPGLKLEDAYYSVKGRRYQSKESQRESRRKAEREAARSAALTATASGKRAGTPSLDRGVPSDRKPMDAWAVYESLKRQAGR